MKVRMKVGLSGTRNGQDWPPRGSVIDLPDAEAKDYIDAGMAEPVAVFDESEKAVAPEPEKRTGLTTETGPVRRGPGRPRKTPTA